MTELNGSLSGIGLRQLLSFLEGLRSGGSLVVEDGPWNGTLMLTEGQLVGAQFGAEQGLAALDAIVLALPRGRFTFSSDIESCEVNIVLKPSELGEHLETIVREATELMVAVPSLNAVPLVLSTDSGDDETGQITVSRRALGLLLALDGRCNVAILARERGVLLTLRELAELTKLGLVGMDTRGPEMLSERAPSTTREAIVEEPRATSAERRVSVGLEAASEHRRSVGDPESRPPTEPTHNGAAAGRRFWNQH